MWKSRAMLATNWYRFRRTLTKRGPAHECIAGFDRFTADGLGVKGQQSAVIHHQLAIRQHRADVAAPTGVDQRRVDVAVRQVLAGVNHQQICPLPDLDAADLVTQSERSGPAKARDLERLAG